MNKKVLVTGAGGFIGHHLVNRLKDEGFWVRGVDIKYPEFEPTRADEFELLDLTERANALEAMYWVDDVYAMAAQMGGMGYIAYNHSYILRTNTKIDLNTIEAARSVNVNRFFYTSSACVYAEYLQEETEITPLKEEDAYPADPQDAYGWQKLTTEKICQYYHDDYGLDTRIVRFHNVFGPLGTWHGGREKAPAALCRKVAEAKLTGNPEVEIWGDGEQTRSFLYIDDCIEGIRRLMESGYTDPLNLGSDRMVSINELVDIIADAAGISVVKKHVEGPQGVRGRNSDNTKLKQVLNWEPRISLEEGIQRTYNWIEEQVRANL